MSSDFVSAGSPLQTGELPPALLGFAPHFTTEASAVTYLFHSSYFNMASQQGLSIEQFNLGVDGIRGSRVNIDVLVGFKQTSDERVVTIS